MDWVEKKRGQNKEVEKDQIQSYSTTQSLHNPTTDTLFIVNTDNP